MDTKKEMLHGGKLARHQGGKISRTRRLLSGLAVSTVLLTGLWSCSSDDPSPVVTVMGDSLSDVGSFGFKATIKMLQTHGATLFGRNSLQMSTALMVQRSVLIFLRQQMVHSTQIQMFRVQTSQLVVVGLLPVQVSVARPAR